MPTSVGIRYFIDEMLKEEEPDSLESTKLKERLFQKRFNRALFIREAVKALSDLVGQVSVALVDDMIFVAGIGYMLQNPEFEDLDLLQNALNVIESESLLSKLFALYRNDSRLKTLIGDEIGIESLSGCSVVFSPFNYYRGTTGYIGVIGPRRMRYERIIPTVRTLSEFIENSVAGWD
jgi:heat-inducible transcriptional repressor